MSMHLRDVSCARLASALAPASRPGTQGWLVTRTSMSVSRWQSVLLSPQRRPGADLLVGIGLSFACRRARACGQQDCLQHHGRLLSTKRYSDGPRFYTRNEGGGELNFRASGRHPNVWVLLNTDEHEHSDRRASCDEAALPRVEPQPGLLDSRQIEATRVLDVSHHLAAVASDALVESELSEQSSSIEHVRLFPTPFGPTSNHHTSDSESPDMLGERTSRASCALGKARVLVSSSFFFSALRDV